MTMFSVPISIFLLQGIADVRLRGSRMSGSGVRASFAEFKPGLRQRIFEHRTFECDQDKTLLTFLPDSVWLLFYPPAIGKRLRGCLHLIHKTQHVLHVTVHRNIRVSVYF